jgi:hypothetical protein
MVRGVQDWLLSHADGRIKALLPLTFHPISMVRRATAVFLAPLLFLPACRLADSTASHGLTSSKASTAPSRVSLRLYALFSSTHYLPLPHVDLELPPPGVAKAGVQQGRCSAADQLKEYGHKDTHLVTGTAAELLEEGAHEKVHLVGLLLSLGKLTAAARARASPEEWELLSSRCSHMCKLLDCLPGAIHERDQQKTQTAILLNIKPLGPIICGVNTYGCSAISSISPANVFDSSGSI